LSIFGSPGSLFNASSLPDAGPPGPFARTIPKKPGEFGYSPTINYPKPEGKFIPGIPRSEPLGNFMIEEIKQQTALLHLCILAETICWSKLFNTAIDAYIQGELNLHRDIPLEHVDLIYTRTHSESTLREFVMDSIRHLISPESHKAYMELAQQHEEFLENLLRNYSRLSEDRTLIRDTKKNYFMSEEPVGGHGLRDVFARKDDEVL
jgi:hypothetical protein